MTFIICDFVITRRRCMMTVMVRSTVSTGLDRLASLKSSLKGLRVGVLCHQASVDQNVEHIVPLLLRHKLNITTLFAPEHGFWGVAQDQIAIEEARTEFPVYSLYGDHRVPSESQMNNIDAMICDLQDVGSRYYTFVWTMALAMQACAKFEKKFIVVDRPNPLGGVTMEGPVLDMNFASFVGLYPTPVRHGMTIGEIAQWLNQGFDLKANLTVWEMKGWRRSMEFEKTGLPWVLPSPNMPTVDTAFVYPGACLIEGTTLSEGRGTTRPFEMTGAPFIDAEKFSDALNAKRLPGVLFRACRFEPTFHKFAKEFCGGAQWHVTDRALFKPFLTGLIYIQTIRQMYSYDFAWRQPPYEYEAEKLPFDILCGTDKVRTAIEQNQSLTALEKSWTSDLAAFARERRPFLLYN